MAADAQGGRGAPAAVEGSEAGLARTSSARTEADSWHARPQRTNLRVTDERRRPANKHWEVQAAKARLDDLLDAVQAEGPQVITREGAEIAVLVSMEQWRALKRGNGPNLKTLLLAPEARTDALAPQRRQLSRRPRPNHR